MAGTITVSGLVADLLSGEKVIGPETMTGSATVGTIDDLGLVAGDNPVQVPLGASVLLLVFSQQNAATVKVRTNENASDAGLPIGAQGFEVLTVGAGVTEFILNASASGVCEISFI
jgi:hypothetical protein